VFAMIAGSITIYATSQISGLFHANAKGKLQDVLRSLAVISSITVVGAFAAVMLGGKLLLSLFGETYVSAYPALIVLALGASVTTLAGPTSYLLLLTGNEGAYPRIMACGLALRFTLIVALGSAFGLIGAAIAWSLAAAALALVLVIASRRLVGVDPSLTSAFTRPVRPAVPLSGSTQ
jgi:O-antigen/teichoic acid export membrane protein